MRQEENLTGDPDSARLPMSAGPEIPVVPPDVVAFGEPEGDPEPPDSGGGPAEGDPPPPDGAAPLGGPRPPAEGDPEPPDNG